MFPEKRFEAAGEQVEKILELCKIEAEKVKCFKFHHTIYSGQELKDRLLQVGFRDIKLYGNLDGEEYGPDASRLIAVACK